MYYAVAASPGKAMQRAHCHRLACNAESVSHTKTFLMPSPFFRLTTRLKNFWVDHHHHFVLPSDIKVMTIFPTF